MNTSITSNKQRLLLHVCCAPCSSHVLYVLSGEYDITLLFYNPNITDKDEYKKRIDELIRFTGMAEFARGICVIDGGYAPEEFFTMSKGLENEPEKGKRCYNCYDMRLKKTAEYAKKQNFDIFTTTLSISPHKNSTWINEIGNRLSGETGIDYLYSDFKKKNGYAHSIQLSKEYNLYRQDYCGCIFSKAEREKKKQQILVDRD